MSSTATQLTLWPAPATSDYEREMRRVLKYAGGYKSLRAWYEKHPLYERAADGRWVVVSFEEEFPRGDVRA